MSKTLGDLLKNFVFLFCLLLPVQFGKHYWPDFSLVQGVRVDYLSPTIYLTDIISFGIVSLYLLANRHAKFFNKWQILILFLLINIFTASYLPAALYSGLKIIQVFALVFVFSKINIDINKYIYIPLFVSAIYVSLIAILQFVNKSTLGGILYFLGERTFNILTPGVALVNIYGENYLRAYSIFSHPNSLAGFLGVVILILYSSNYTLKHKYIFLIVLSTAFLLTFSAGGFTALVLALLVSKYKSLQKPVLIVSTLAAVSLILFSISPFIQTNYLSINERLQLNEVGIKLIYSSPLFGVGLKNYLYYVPEMLPANFFFSQPVHNALLLVLVETGVVGLLLAINILIQLTKVAVRNKTLLMALVFIFTTSLFDHYWLTLQQNLLLLALVLGLVLRSGVKSYDATKH